MVEEGWVDEGCNTTFHFAINRPTDQPTDGRTDGRTDRLTDLLCDLECESPLPAHHVYGPVVRPADREGDASKQRDSQSGSCVLPVKRGHAASHLCPFTRLCPCSRDTHATHDCPVCGIRVGVGVSGQVLPPCSECGADLDWMAESCHKPGIRTRLVIPPTPLSPLTTCRSPRCLTVQQLSLTRSTSCSRSALRTAPAPVCSVD